MSEDFLDCRHGSFRHVMGNYMFSYMFKSNEWKHQAQEVECEKDQLTLKYDIEVHGVISGHRQREREGGGGVSPSL